jgi:retron-type reverse transcriptase
MFKAASVTPLIKKAGLDEVSLANFRPISNLNNISKLIERLFLSRLQPHTLGSPHFDHLQSAYRPHHSTETALLLSLNNIYQAADNSQPSSLVLLDLSAAFDTVDHSLLLSRHQTSFSISGTALSWLTSYLLNRPQLVRIGQSSFFPTSLDSGEPGDPFWVQYFYLFISPQLAN